MYICICKDNPSYYADARDAAKKVIDSKSCELAPNFQSLYLSDNYMLSESIFPNIRGDVPNDHIYGSFIPVIF